jgi:hypothetical protein
MQASLAEIHTGKKYTKVAPITGRKEETLPFVAVPMPYG